MGCNNGKVQFKKEKEIGCKEGLCDEEEDDLLEAPENTSGCGDDPRLGVYKAHGDWYSISMTDEKKLQYNQEDDDGVWQFAVLMQQGDDFVGKIKASDSGDAVGTIRICFNGNGVAVHSINGGEDIISRKDEMVDWDQMSVASRKSRESYASDGESEEKAVDLQGVVVSTEEEPDVPIASVACMYVVGGRGTRGVLSSVEWLDRRTYQWKDLPPMEKPLEDAGAVVVNKDLIVVGGNTGDPVSAVLCFDGETECWKVLPNMSIARSACAVAASEDLVYVAGGKSSNEAQSVVASAERLNTKTKLWEALPPMKYERSHCAAAMLHSMLYVIGGCSSDGTPIAVCERFDPKTSCWEEMPSLKTPRFACAAVAAEGCLYVIGGRSAADCLATVDYFEPDKGRWASIAPMEIPRACCAAVAVGDDLYVAGGMGMEEYPLSTVERFQTERERWLMLPAMTIGRTRCAAAAAAAEDSGPSRYNTGCKCCHGPRDVPAETRS
eukprot:gnl/MRDRNA2_/MRDRNA2_35500_c0_seq1.p1 gnl/MRDRNA2_/MRDRNA2_35500_c0~~gnl/MRDRNA2_/MRDRNA2_35500_c0_seq1.p1  ORF type:complete len:495 (-),score=99.97 gnl/MRDRNA2_/MRDRNA2_35500_c0_seq1:332-1816(-)